VGPKTGQDAVAKRKKNISLLLLRELILSCSARSPVNILRQQDLPKRWYPTPLHGATTQKTTTRMHADDLGR
jgi:hypothetical protein